MTLSKDFVSKEEREYKVKIGATLASALTGFVAGAVSASLIFYVMLNIIQNGA